MAALLLDENLSSRRQVARRVCDEFGFFDARGRHQEASCRAALISLERTGRILLPAPRHGGGGGGPRLSDDPAPAPSGVPERVDQIVNLRLAPVEGGEDRLVWNRLIADEHPLGAVTHAGCQRRWLIVSEHGILGAIGVSAAALRLKPRDEWIGWDDKTRALHLNRVVNLSRFLIRPEVDCANLGSRALSMCMARLAGDFNRCYGFRPVLVETFVDRSVYTGTVFAASEFVKIGETSGRGRFAARSDAPKSVKAIWVRPLDKRWRRKLGVVPLSLGPADGLDRESWAENEFGGARLGDKRLSRRLVRSAEVMADDPREPFTAAAQGDKALVRGYYRMIDHPSETDVTPENILGPHRKRSTARMQGCREVLCIQDGSDLNFATHPKCGNLGLIGKNRGSKGTLGLHMHSTLAIDASSGVPLGVLRIEWDAPDGQAERNKALEDRKSARWLRGLRDQSELARSLEGVRTVAVLDREADFFGLFAESRRLGNVDLLVRAKFNRSLGKGEKKLFDRLAARPEQGRIGIAVKRLSARNSARGQTARPAREARTAEVTVRWRRYDIPPTGDHAGEKPVPLTLISVREEAPPEGVKPLCWNLLTSLPVNGLKEARRILDRYALRWRIEDWHRILKSGCKAELLDHQDGERIERTVAIKAVIAWRLAVMVMLGRETPQLPAEILFSDIEIKMLGEFADDRGIKPPENLGEAVITMAILGGYLNRNSDPPPGHRIIWRGYTRLAAYAQCVQLLIRRKNESRFSQCLRQD